MDTFNTVYWYSAIKKIFFRYYTRELTQITAQNGARITTNNVIASLSESGSS